MDDIELLLKACGIRAPLTLDIEQRANELITTVALEFPFATIGRTSSNDVVLDDDQVSRRHAYLQVIDGRVFCVDFRSRTGTHRDGSTGSGWLSDSQSVKIGRFTIRLRPLERDENARWPDSLNLADPLNSKRNDLDPLPKFTLQFVKGVRVQSDWHMRRVLALVGSSPQCKVQLIDPRVSRYHCSLLRTPHGTWVIDLLGRGGVRLNGTRIRFAQLRDGDEVQVGGVKTRAKCEEPRQDPVQGLEAAPGSAGKLSSAKFTRLVPVTKPEANLLPRPIMSPDRMDLMVPPTPLSTELKVNDQESVVNTLLYHFGQVQQQMAEQFNQAVMTMVQMFSTFHRDQMELVRAELDRLHDLNHEIVEIQRELSKGNTVRKRKLAAGDSHLLEVRDSGTDENLAEGGVGQSEAPEQKLGSSSSKASPGGSRQPRPNTRNPVEAGGLSGGESSKGVSQPKGVAASGPGEAARGRDSAKGQSPGAGPPPGEDVHAWLCHRMEVIRAEQQTLWQKILTTVRSTMSGG